MADRSKTSKDSKSADEGAKTPAPSAAATTVKRCDPTPTIFADELLGGFKDSGVYRLELVGNNFDPETQSNSKAVVGRLLIPADKFAAFVAASLDLLKKTSTPQQPAA